MIVEPPATPNTSLVFNDITPWRGTTRLCRRHAMDGGGSSGEPQ